MKIKIEIAVAQAQEDFWETIARHFPECVTGDLAPGPAIAFDQACTDVVTTWLEANRPKPTIPASICGGILHMGDGTRVDLLDIQYTLNMASQEVGNNELARCANELAKLTGKVQGPHGEWLDREEEELK